MTVIVIVPLVLVGFDLTVLRVNGWFRRVHPHIGVVHSCLVGWLVVILVWRMVRWAGQCAFTGIGTAVCGQPTSKLEIAGLTTFTTSVVHLLVVISATVAVTKLKQHCLHKTSTFDQKLNLYFSLHYRVHFWVFLALLVLAVQHLKLCYKIH